MKNVKSQSRVLSFLLILLLFATCILTGCGNAKSEITETSAEKVQEYLYDTVSEPICGSVGGEWALIALLRGGYDVGEEYKETYVKNVETFVQENDGILHTPTGYKYTEYSRIILGWTAAGKNPEDVGGYNFLERLSDMENVCRQGINGPIWALIALDCGGYEIPQSKDAAVQTSRQKLVQYLLDEQLEDGGWTLSGEAADVDLTAMALTALAPYENQDKTLCAQVSESSLKKVHTAVEKALNCLSSLQNDDGGFESWGSENAESVSQVITALSALGIDAQTDERFVKASGDPVQALLSFQQENGGFSHIKDSETNGMASEQAAYALAAYMRMSKGKAALFDMREDI